MDREYVCHMVARDAVQDVYAGYVVPVKDKNCVKRHGGKRVRSVQIVAITDEDQRRDAERDYAARFKAVKDLLLANAPKRVTFAQARAVLATASGGAS